MPAIGSDMPIEGLRNVLRVYYHWGKFQTHAFHVVPSIDPIVLISCGFTWSAKLALEKQTSQLILVMHCDWVVYECSLSPSWADTIWNRPSLTF